jgi:hypothetical protein
MRSTTLPGEIVWLCPGELRRSEGCGGGGTGGGRPAPALLPEHTQPRRGIDKRYLRAAA